MAARGRTVLLGGAAAAVATAALLAGAGPASAYTVWMQTDGSANGKYGTGCTYTIKAHGSDVTPITVSDDAKVIDVKTPNAAGDVEVEWKPATKGPHVLRAQQPGRPAATLARTVGTGLNLGSSCPVVD
ncbi:hypothetical protein [Gordonia sp. ABSL49_1]|uniref:hypothetical protein n=2 Tax=Gordonia TaxID=2053 RepID=UPI001F0FE08C|nr:hypothetical protein [Gordonia sp. ABSL49_1]MCH5644209.1 hypothetical protein [Gordonia sp. ABSL49_1]